MTASTRSLLLYIPGLPLSLEALCPQRALACVAAMLLRQEHWTKILDYGVLDALESLLPSESAKWEGFPSSAHGSGGGARLDAFLQARRDRSVERLLQEGLRRQALSITEDILKYPRLDFIVFYVRERQDLLNARLVGDLLGDVQPGLLRVAVGPYVALAGARCLGSGDEIDAVCTGDPESSIAALADRMRGRTSWTAIPGLFVRGAPAGTLSAAAAPAPLDDFAPPVYDQEVYPAIDRKLSLYTVEQTRGRLAACLDEAWRPEGLDRVRVRSVATIRDEITGIRLAQGSHAFHIQGAAAHATQSLSLAAELRMRRLPIAYSRDSEVRQAEPAVMRLLADSGCQVIGFNVRTGSQRLLEDFYGCPFGVSETETVLNSCRDAGISTSLRFTFPCPHDDVHTAAESLRLASRCHPMAFEMSPPVLLPSTGWMQRPTDYGFVVVRRRLSAWLEGDSSLYAGRDSFPADLPYRVKGRSRRKAAAAFRRLSEALAALRIAPLSSPQMTLVARVAQPEGVVFDTAALWNAALRDLNLNLLNELKTQFNAQAKPSSSSGWRRFEPLRAAAGN